MDKIKYTFVNSKRKSTGFPSFIKFIDKKSCSVDVICDMYADFFASTYSNVPLLGDISSSNIYI